MNTRLLFVLSALLAFSLVDTVSAGCPGGMCSGGSCAGGSCSGGFCSAPAAPAAPVAQAGYEWREVPDAPRQRALFSGGFQIGGYNLDTGCYRSYDVVTDIWGPPTYPWGAKAGKVAAKKACACGCDKCDNCKCDALKKCSKDCKCCTDAKAKTEEHKESVDLLESPGVDAGRIQQTGETYRLNGDPVSPETGKNAIQGGGQIPNDATLPRLTVIGNQSECQAVLTDLETLHLKEGLVVQCYAPDNWAVAKAGFVTGGHPTIYLQSHDGTVLHRQDSYTGPEAMSAAVRRARQGYDPTKDPNLNQPINLAQIPPMAALAGGSAALLGFLALLRRNQL